MEEQTTIYVTEYQYYEQWHPAEGGIWLGGREPLETKEFTDKQQVFDYLEKCFKEACEYFDIEESAIVTETKDYGYIKKAETESYFIFLKIDKELPLFENFYEDDYGYENEEYHSYVYVEPRSKYHPEESFSFKPESKKGLHARIPMYC